MTDIQCLDKFCHTPWCFFENYDSYLLNFQPFLVGFRAFLPVVFPQPIPMMTLIRSEPFPIQIYIYIWLFPKIGGKPPKWMVCNGKPY